MPQRKLRHFYKEISMKNKEIFRTVKFVLFSASAAIVQTVANVILYSCLNFQEALASALAMIASVLWNFTFNRRYTFKSADKVGKAMLLTALFYCVFIPLTSWLADCFAKMEWNYYLGQAIIMVLNLVTEFLYQRFVVYRNSVDTNELAK